MSGLIAREVHDPRIGFVTVSKVDVTPDLRHATCGSRSSGSPPSASEALRALGRAMPFLRHRLGELRLKRIPELHLREDETVLRGTRVLHLIEELEAGHAEPTVPAARGDAAHAGHRCPRRARTASGRQPRRPKRPDSRRSASLTTRRRGRRPRGGRGYSARRSPRADRLPREPGGRRARLRARPRPRSWRPLGGTRRGPSAPMPCPPMYDFMPASTRFRRAPEPGVGLRPHRRRRLRRPRRASARCCATTPSCSGGSPSSTSTTTSPTRASGRSTGSTRRRPRRAR